MSQRTTRHSGVERTDGAPTPSDAKHIGSRTSGSGLAQRKAAPQSLAEAEARYVSCRDAWTAAMRAAASGRPADMATLALCQEEYEAASHERDRWLSGDRIAIPVQPEADRAAIDVVVDQTMAWRDVHQHGKRRGILGRLLGPRDRRRD